MKIHIFNKENRALLGELVRTDFKLRYQGSALGYAWSLLRPLMLFIILYVVFVVIFPLGKGIPHYPIYLLLGIVLWNFFNELTVLSLSSIVEQGALLRKIRIPRWIIVLSTSISALINLFFNLLVVLVFIFINHADLLKSALLFPFILLEIYLFALGISLWLSALFVKYRDIKYIWEVVLQAGFYLTPILYPVSKITNVTAQKLMMLNPMAQAVQDSRYTVVSHDPKVVTASRLFQGGWHEYIPFVLVILLLLSGLRYFRGQSKYFAENV